MSSSMPIASLFYAWSENLSFISDLVGSSPKLTSNFTTDPRSSECFPASTRVACGSTSSIAFWRWRDATNSKGEVTTSNRPGGAGGGRSDWWDFLGLGLLFFSFLLGRDRGWKFEGSGSQLTGTGPKLEGQSWTLSWNGLRRLEESTGVLFISVLGRDRNTEGVGILSWDGICEDLTGFELDCQGSRGFMHCTYYWRLEGKKQRT